MKNIYIENISKQTLGGGFIFLSNFKKGSEGKAEFVKSWQESHCVFVGSVTMANRDELSTAKSKGKRILLRIDNMPKDSRNRGTAFSRMRDIAKMADVIVFQSKWAKEYVGTWLADKHGVDLSKSKVIYNGVDPEFFYCNNKPTSRGETYLFCTYNRDENKRFPEAAYDFHKRHVQARKEGRQPPKLKIVGNFSPENMQYNFDFFDDEVIEHMVPIDSRKQMGNLYRSCQYLYFPAFADASPNTVSEALACGCKILLANDIGGTKEVIEVFSKSTITIQEMADQYLELAFGD